MQSWRDYHFPFNLILLAPLFPLPEMQKSPPMAVTWYPLPTTWETASVRGKEPFPHTLPFSLVSLIHRQKGPYQAQAHRSRSPVHFTSPKQLGGSQLLIIHLWNAASRIFAHTCCSTIGCLSSFILPCLTPHDPFLSFLSPVFNHRPSQTRLMKALFSLYNPSV